MASGRMSITKNPAGLEPSPPPGGVFQFGGDMINAFDTEVAQLVGVNAAVLFKNIEYWVEKNATNGKNEHDGRYWTYNSMKAYEEQFPYLTGNQIRTALTKLEDAGLVITGCFNEIAYDRTKWYTVTEKGYSICGKASPHLGNFANQFAKKPEPIPDDYQMTTNKTPPIAPPDERQADVEKVVAHLNEVTGKGFRATSESTRKPIRARLEEGYTVDDCMAVIDVKVSQWWRDPKMKPYLRPETLFRKSKFEGYLQESPVADMADCPF